MPIALEVSPAELTLWILIGLFALAVVAAVIGRIMFRHGMQPPVVVRLVNRVSDRVLEQVKRPITIAVLDEVADVLRTGHYTQNLASALRENHEHIKAMVAEKIKGDPSAGRISMVPFHDRLIDEVTETTLRVILEVLMDPRTDEIVADVLRDNINQIRTAVREDTKPVVVPRTTPGEPPQWRPRD